MKRVVERYGQSTGGYNATVGLTALVFLPCYKPVIMLPASQRYCNLLKGACKGTNSQLWLVPLYADAGRIICKNARRSFQDHHRAHQYLACCK